MAVFGRPTAQCQDAVFQVSPGLTGAGGEAVLEPDPGSIGEVRIKKYNALPIILDGRDMALIRERVGLPLDRPGPRTAVGIISCLRSSLNPVG